MRDMLERLQTISEEQEDYDPDCYDSPYDTDKVTLSQEAVIFENSSVIDDILKKAESIRKEISLLRLEVDRLNFHNDRFGTSMRRLTILRKDSDSIARGIQQRAESVYAHLQALGKDSKALEEKEGPNCAVSRIAMLQYDTLTRALQDAMSGYSEAEEKQRSMCRTRIQRHASILGREISDKQLDMLVNKGGEGWMELSQNLQTQGGRSCRMALCDIKGRHKDLVELETRLKEIHDLFIVMATLVEEQGAILNNIEANVCKTQDYVGKFNFHMRKAIRYKRKNPCLQCCPCLPCWSSSQTF